MNKLFRAMFSSLSGHGLKIHLELISSCSSLVLGFGTVFLLRFDNITGRGLPPIGRPKADGRAVGPVKSFGRGHRPGCWRLGWSVGRAECHPNTFVMG